MPQRYLDKFPGVKSDPQKAAQYSKARLEKKRIAQNYHPNKLLPGMHQKV